LIIIKTLLNSITILEITEFTMFIEIQGQIFLQRNLLYTGITRGKKMVALVGTKKAIAIAIRNNKPKKMYKLLKDRLLSIKSVK
jgi:ATP-dependent exoDNAse (exonuclease V) alpha subunit